MMAATWGLKGHTHRQVNSVDIFPYHGHQRPVRCPYNSGVWMLIRTYYLQRVPSWSSSYGWCLMPSTWSYTWLWLKSRRSTSETLPPSGLKARGVATLGPCYFFLIVVVPLSGYLTVRSNVLSLSSVKAARVIPISSSGWRLKLKELTARNTFDAQLLFISTALLKDLDVFSVPNSCPIETTEKR